MMASILVCQDAPSMCGLPAHTLTYPAMFHNLYTADPWSQRLPDRTVPQGQLQYTYGQIRRVFAESFPLLEGSHGGLSRCNRQRQGAFTRGALCRFPHSYIERLPYDSTRSHITVGGAQVAVVRDRLQSTSRCTHLLKASTPNASIPP